MASEWLKNAVGSLFSICLLAGLLECVEEGTEGSNGFRLLCGAVVSASAVNAVVQGIHILLGTAL